MHELEPHLPIDLVSVPIQVTSACPTVYLRESKLAMTKDDIYLRAEAAADAANLRYVSDSEDGYTRARKGKGFAYYAPGGAHVKDETLKKRFKALVIPPMWNEVWICKDAKGHIQVTGRDDRGRKQYIYHERWREVRDRAKFDHLIDFAEALPGLRGRLYRDMGKDALPKEKVVAAIVKLLETTLIRVGNKSYAKRNKTYGLTTLRRKHVDIDGNEIEFSFKGKSGVEHDISIENPKLARIVKACDELPGYELFQYVDDDGERQNIDSADVNAYLKEVTGRSFSAKDFRTWAATTSTFGHLYGGEEPQSDEAAKKAISETIKRVAEELGNTPAVCRSSYVHPFLLELYETGDFHRRAESIDASDAPRGLRKNEHLTCELIRSGLKVS